MNNIVIVYPYNDTTLFLNSIIDHLHQITPNNYLLLTIEPNALSHQEVFTKIGTLPHNSTIIFLGHGSNNCIYSAKSETFSAYPFINSDNINIFSNQYLFCFSCRSASFLKKNMPSTSINAAIGFEDIPSEWDEITAARVEDYNAYSGFNESCLNLFVDTITYVVKKTLEDYIIFNLTFDNLYNFLILRINQQINKLLLDPNKENESILVAKQLFILKKEMIFFCS